MSKLTVVFSGVVGFVPHTSRPAYRVLLPNTLLGSFTNGKWQHQRKHALDGKPLRMHQPFLRWQRNLWLILNEHIRFDFQGAQTTRSSPSGCSPMPADAIRIGDVVENPHGEIDARAVTDPASATDLVAGYLDIDRGELSIIPNRADQWIISNTLNPNNPQLQRVFAQEIHWTVDQLNGNVSVTVTPFSGDGTRYFDLPTADEDVTIYLMNLEPRHIVRDYYGPSERRFQQDDDFRWYYQLLTSDAIAWIHQRLSASSTPTTELPIPVRAMRIREGHACMPVVYPAAAWS